MCQIQNYSSYSKSDFEIFRNLSPAATKLIVAPKETELSEVLKLTFLDLLFKKVLILKTEIRASNSRDPHLREYLIVETGEAYKNYIPKRFEKKFLDLIDEGSYYILRAYLKQVYKSIDQSYSFNLKILNDCNKLNLFQYNMIYHIFRNLKLTTQGKAFQSTLKAKLDYINGEIIEILSTDPKKAFELIDLLRGNIFLIENLNFELLKDLSKINLAHHITSDCNDDWYWIDFFSESDYLFDTLSDSFDSLDTFVDSDFGSSWDGGSDFDFD